jgi:hypothetical protein
MLQLAKFRLAVVTNNRWDRPARAALDLGVKVQEWEIQALGQERADSAFAGSREADEDEVTVHLSRCAM